jgi:hypothetical protein
MLKAIDDLEVFERTPDGPMPFLLLDGHHSRLEVPFLDYIFDEEHKWYVCIGVPYGTHYWQVADSSELNGTYKMALTRGKEIHFNAKPPGHKGWAMTDIIPLLNYAYPFSFGNIARGRKAILNRGWGPLNYCLLLNPDILKTKGSEEGESSEPSGVEGGQEDSNNLSAAVSKARIFNNKKGNAADLMDACIRETMKEDGRLEKIRQKRQQEETLAGTAKKLKEMTKVTSGALASHGMYFIVPGTHQEVTSRKAARTATDAETQNKRAARDQRLEMNRQTYRNKRLVTTRATMPKDDLIRGISQH